MSVLGIVLLIFAGVIITLALIGLMIALHDMLYYKQKDKDDRK